MEHFRQNLGPFVVAAETTRTPMVFMDARRGGHRITFANDSFLSLLGYARDEVLGQSFDSLMAPGVQPQAWSQVLSAFEDGSDVDREVRYCRKDGTSIWASMRISPVRNQDGVVVQHFASISDLTAHKQEQAELKLLVDELNHRVKNTLSTVQAIVSQALRNSSDLAVVAEAVESRLSSLSRSHDLLTRESWHSAGLADVILAALDPFGVADDRAERFAVAGENIRFSPKAALAISIAIHELATNAVKYGALSNDAGCVRVTWALVSPNGASARRVVLRWQEVGGPPVAPPVRKGFGSGVLECGLAYELAGVVQLDYPRDGVVCTIDIPAPSEAGHE